MRLALTRRLAALIVVLGLLGSLAAATPVLAAAITVNSLDDTIVDDDLCTLREAITTANDDTPIGVGGAGNDCATGSGPDTITFGMLGTITLSSALPAILDDLSIDGAGAITLDGGNAHQVFRVLGEVELSGLTITAGGGPTPVGGGVDNSGTLTLTNSTITGSNATDQGGGIFNNGTLTITNSMISGSGAFTGGGIYNEGTLSATGSTISGNSAGFLGAGIFNEGTLTLTDSTINGSSGPLTGGGIYNEGTLTATGSTISGNSSTFSGGGIANQSFAATTITNSTISGNTTGQAGGGILNDGTLTVTTSTISGNSADFGAGIATTGSLTMTSSTINGNTGGAAGGIINSGTLTITNSTISGNMGTTTGGGIDNNGTLTITNSTITGNSAVVGSGVLAGGTEILVNSIVAGNVNSADVVFAVETVTTSVIGVPVGKTLADILDPAGLADNGGPTQTIALALVAGNPAIDTGTSATCAAPPVSGLDQRGLPRPAACDIGAYEAQPPTVAAHATVTATATSTSGAAVTFTSPAGTDEQGGSVPVGCLPASGSTFPVGSTTVTCTATDAVGHTGTGTFAITVSAPGSTSTPAPSPTALPNTADVGTPDRMPAQLGALALISLLVLGALRQPSIRSRLRREMATVRKIRGSS